MPAATTLALAASKGMLTVSTSFDATSTKPLVPPSENTVTDGSTSGASISSPPPETTTVLVKPEI
jgi:hypothetical protein